MLTDLLRRNSIFDQLERRLSNWARTWSDRSRPQMASADDRLRLRIPLPGMSREDVEITAVGRTLRIRAFRTETEDENNVSEYEEVLMLPESVNISKASASMRHGLLELSLPYHEAVKPRRIEIESDTRKQLSSAA